ncbi:hypothetical protein B0H13DRAFT_1899240 [Mycena leptocephala]|nr:hypothetical protein B0H13DRAFT_1899240 [Mycena leptocephala]
MSVHDLSPCDHADKSRNQESSLKTRDLAANPAVSSTLPPILHCAVSHYYYALPDVSSSPHRTVSLFTLAARAAPEILDNIYEVPTGGSIVYVGNEVHALAANGTVFKPLDSHASGTVADVNFFNIQCPPISSFTTTWEVPPLPTLDNGQTLRLYSALETRNNVQGVGIGSMQPVLTYSGGAWSVASWHVIGITIFSTPSVPINPGSTLHASLTLANSPNSTSHTEKVFGYTVQFDNIQGTSMTVSGIQQFTWSRAALEAFNILDLTEYPPVDTIVFREMNVKFLGGATTPVSWDPGFPDTADNISLTVDKDGATGAQATIRHMMYDYICLNRWVLEFVLPIPKTASEASTDGQGQVRGVGRLSCKAPARFFENERLDWATIAARCTKMVLLGAQAA